MIKTKEITRTAAFTAVAVLLGYVESLFPPIAAGVKLGLANTVVLTVLYTDGWKKAFAVSVLKVMFDETDEVTEERSSVGLETR